MEKEIMDKINRATEELRKRNNVISVDVEIILIKKRPDT